MAGRGREGAVGTGALGVARHQVGGGGAVGKFQHTLQRAQVTKEPQVLQRYREG